MLAAGVVVVLMDPDMATAEVFVQFRHPLACALGVAGGDQAKCGATIGILLALEDVDDGIWGRGQEFRKPIRNRHPPFGFLAHPMAVDLPSLGEPLINAHSPAVENLDLAYLQNLGSIR